MNVVNNIISKYQAHLKIAVNRLADFDGGLTVIYPSWSADQRFLTVLFERARLKQFSGSITVIDIDSPVCRAFEERCYIRNQGKCEMYVIKDSKVVHKILQHDAQMPEKNIDQLLVLTSVCS